MLDKVKSRKLIVTVLAAALVVLNDKLQLGLSQETIYGVCAILGVYVIGQGVADHGAQGKIADAVVPNDDGPNWEDTSGVDGDDKKELLG